MGRKTTMRRRRRPLGPPAVVFRRLFVVVVVFFASMRAAANALSVADDESVDDDERVEFDVDADDYSNAFATLMNAAEDDDDDENMESYALQLDDFTGEILKPPRQKARREPEWMASLASLPSNCTTRNVVGRETLKVPDVSLRRMPLRLPTNRIALKDIFVTRENYKRLGFGGIKRYYALPPNAAAIAKKYRWKRCAVLGNSGARKDVNASRVAFFKRLRKWREHSRRSLSLSFSLSLS